MQAQVDQRDAETRRNAVIGLINVVRTVGPQCQSSEGLNPEQCKKIYDAFIQCLSDYCTDNRGDVGSWVREQAMTALKDFLIILLQHDVAFAQGGFFG